VACNILEYNSFEADIEADMIEQVDTLIEEVEAVVESLASWLFRTLRTEYEYQTSEQMLIDQDENYDEEGEIIYEQPNKHTGG
jgi:trans-2-enoyl-CoA reductase